MENVIGKKGKFGTNLMNEILWKFKLYGSLNLEPASWMEFYVP